MKEEGKKEIIIVQPSKSDEDAKAQGLDDWSKDRMSLLSWRPFMGTLAMNLELIPVVDHRCATAATDGRRIYFNPHFLNSLSQEERLTILAHEIWHCGLSHFSREDGKIEEHEMWNHAIDHEVNSLLQDDGFAIPIHAVLYKNYKGESAEIVFEKIKSGEIEMRGEVIDDHNLNNPSKSGEDAKNSGTDGWSTIEADGDGNLNVKVDSDYNPRRTDDVWKDWKNKMMSAAQQCQDRGVEMGAYSGKLNDLFDSKIYWRELLRQYLTPLFGGTRKWLPPNRRYVYKKMYLPSIQKEKQLKIVIAVDTSGSTIGDVVKTFVSEVYSILNSFGGYELRLIQCDMDINSDEIFDIDHPFIPDDFVLRGGGGTDFRPVFQLVEESGEPPELLLYLTDGYGTAPKDPPEYPTIWGVIEGGRMPCDWGKEIEIDLGH